MAMRIITFTMSVMTMIVMVMMVIVMVVMVIMVVMMVIFLISVNQHPDMAAGNAALHTFLKNKFYPGDPKSVQLGKGLFPVFRQFQQGGGEHVARGTHGTV
jgi:uncharacterized membrane protein